MRPQLLNIWWIWNFLFVTVALKQVLTLPRPQTLCVSGDNRELLILLLPGTEVTGLSHLALLLWFLLTLKTAAVSMDVLNFKPLTDVKVKLWIDMRFCKSTHKFQSDQNPQSHSESIPEGRQYILTSTFIQSVCFQSEQQGWPELLGSPREAEM